MGNDSICAISSLDLATQYIRGKATVDGIFRAIAITSMMLLLLVNLVSEVLKVETVDKN